MNDLGSLLALAKPYQGRLSLLIFVSLLGSAASLALPWLGARLIGNVLQPGSSSIGAVVTALVLVLIALAILTIANSLLSSAVSGHVLADFRARIHDHVQHLPISFHEQNRQGDLLSVMSSDIARLGSFVSHWLAAAVSAVATAAGAFLVLIWIDQRLALFMPVLLPIYFIIQKLMARRLRQVAGAVRDAEARVLARAEQTLEIMLAVKAFAKESEQQRKYARDLEIARNLNLDLAKIYGILGPTNQLVAGLAVIAILMFLGQQGAAKDINATELFGFLFYAALLTRPIGALADLYGEYNGARGSLERLQQVLKEKVEAGYSATTRVDQAFGALTIKDVWYSYPGQTAILQGASFSVAAGEVVALTGENGAGKTTIARLLLGLQLPLHGAILLDGIDTARINSQDLRRQIGFVSQRTQLFSGTVFENIGWGLEAPDIASTRKAASVAQALDFIERLPAGFETEIGDNGVRLSGGQQQRIMLARALAKDPPILILDEATSMFDPVGEQSFVEGCKSALSGRTVLLITHRPASLALADRILRVEAGRVLEVTEL